MKSIAIGIAGTAKNTGKTTTTSAIMEEVQKNRDICLALTSIGYDGEDLDNVTGLPKPRVSVWPGVLVAIAEKCLSTSLAKIEVIEKTNICTPLGRVIIGQVISAGRLVVAGPNKSKELRKILDLLRDNGANFIIVDGALNRLAPMVEVDGLIIATGAARTADIKKLSWETKAIVEILQFPIINEQSKDTINFNCILDQKETDRLIEKLQDHTVIRIQGIIGEKCLAYLLQNKNKLKGKQIIFTDNLKLLICSDINNIYKILTELKNAGLRIGVNVPIKLIGITVNPYFPQYRFSTEDYQASYVDGAELYATIKNSVNVPVYDVVKYGGRKLFQDILNYWQDLKTVAK